MAAPKAGGLQKVVFDVIYWIFDIFTLSQSDLSHPPGSLLDFLWDLFPPHLYGSVHSVPESTQIVMQLYSLCFERVQGQVELLMLSPLTILAQAFVITLLCSELFNYSALPLKSISNIDLFSPVLTSKAVENKSLFPFYSF